MPSRTYANSININPNTPNVKLTSSYKSTTWAHSPRRGGRLQLVANPMTRTFKENISFSLYGHGYQVPSLVGDGWMPTTSSKEVSQARVLAQNSALAKLRGKLYNGGASLGVTAASYRQSRDMIVSKVGSATRQIAALEHRARAIGYDRAGSGLPAWKRRKVLYSKRRVKREKKSIASAYLEVIFGWQPLLADIHASMHSVVQKAIPSFGVGSRSTVEFTYSHALYHPTGAPRSVVNASGNVRVSINTLVSVSNPNLWLASRMGIINPAVVAWDLVPWSFVINMFANVNQLLNQYTDYAGLSFGNLSTTTTTSMSGSCDAANTYPVSHPFFGGGISTAQQNFKSRGVGSMPAPSLVCRVPDLNPELAATAVSLLVQRSKTLAKFLSL